MSTVPAFMSAGVLLAFTTITRRAFAGSQAREFEHILTAEIVPGVPRRLRVFIRRNAYIDQSFGRVECWDGDRWLEVFVLRGVELKCLEKCSYVDKGPAIPPFEEDEAELLRVAAAVLGA